MKYGIMTYHNIPNFGAVLQAFSLCEVIKQLGYHCEIIDYECENIKNRELVFQKPNNPIKAVLHKVFIWPHVKRKIIECQKFIQNDVSDISYNRNNISQSNDRYDCFISGSDMIWNMDVNGYDYSFFLDFVKDHKRKISYGSSIGGIWSVKQIDGIKKYLSKYDSIAVREKDTCQTMEKDLKLSCTTVVDPTMLCTADDWNRYTTDGKDSNYVLVYFPTNELIEAARKYSLEHAKKLIILQTRLPFKRKNSKIIYSPSEWMSYIKYADAVFTDSYHGLLFSLYFNKPVWTNNNSNRISTLLEELGLETCYIKNDEELKNKIDYDRCNRKIEKMRNNSLDYLKSVLKG